jgi:predicted transcriptional regulator
VESRMANETTEPRLHLQIARIVASYLRRHRVAPADLPALIGSVRQALGSLGTPVASSEERIPAVPVRRSVRREYVVCLECGFRGRALRRHLRMAHGLPPQEYRARWKLSSDHPIIAPAYSELRSASAKQLGFGLRRTTRAEPPAVSPQVAAASGGEALDPAFVASLASIKRRRSRSAAPKP